MGQRPFKSEEFKIGGGGGYVRVNGVSGFVVVEIFNKNVF